jgi:hypothetical protein
MSTPTTPDITAMINEAVKNTAIMRAAEMQECFLVQIDHLWNRGYRSSEIADTMRFIIAEYLE